MKNIFLLLSCGIVCCMMSCKTSKKPEEIYSENAPSVVMIVSQYYYQVTLPNGNTMYFSGFDEDGDPEDLSSDLDELGTARTVITGTGFFISQDGKILTNRHVVKPEMNDKNVKSFFNKVKDVLKLYCQYRIAECKEKIDSLTEEMANCLYIDYDGDLCYRIGCQDRYERLDKEQDEYIELRKETQKELNSVGDLNMEDILVEPICEYGIAYNDTHVTKFLDLADCVLLNESENEKIDLATLQIKNHQTPDNVQVAKFYDADDDEGINMGDELYMIGYNAGFAVSNTAQGVKSQIYPGTLTQSNDGYRIMYNISALPGSSGSPVFDRYGYVVAVNFAGITASQNFNYGIPAKRVREYLDKE